MRVVRAPVVLRVKCISLLKMQWYCLMYCFHWGLMTKPTPANSRFLLSALALFLVLAEILSITALLPLKVELAFLYMKSADLSCVRGSAFALDSRMVYPLQVCGSE